MEEYEFEEEDYKAIAKMVFDDDKKDIIEYAEKVYAKQGDNEPIDKNITFDELWDLIDHDIFQEYNEENWEYWKNEYIK